MSNCDAPQAKRSNQNFSLNAHAESGNVTVYIPSDFEGPIHFTHDNGSLSLSNEIRKRTKHLMQSSNDGRAYIGTGDWDDARYTEKSSWGGDKLTVCSRSGNIRVRFTDESEDGLLRDLRSASNAVTGLFKRMWGPSTGPQSPPGGASESIDGQ